MKHTAPAPRQTKLLGATVYGLGTLTAVSSTLPYCYAVVEGSDGTRQVVPLADLRRDEVTFPVSPQPFYTAVERVSYGTWDEVHALAAPAAPAVALLAAA